MTGRARRTTAPDRVSSDDLMSLVGGRQAVPLQAGAILVLADGATLDPGAVRSALEQRLAAVPRLRRRLVRPPFGLGRPVWVDHATFDLDEHLVVHATAEPLSHQGLLDLAARLLESPLPPDRPLWRATFVPDVRPGRAALIVVFHHVLADGVAGLTLLADLLAPEAAPLDPAFPRPEPSRRALLLDALAGRLRSLGRVPASVTRLVGALAELGPALRSTAEPCSLNQPTGPTRSLHTASTDLQVLVDVAHRHGATVNDVILAAVAGALRELLADRGEQVRHLVVSVPFATPPTRGGTALGNHSGVMPVRLVTAGSFTERLAATAASTRVAKQHLRGASTAVLAPMFRLLDRLGLYQRFVDHQRTIHTFVSNVRGPVGALGLLGHRLVELVPLSLASGNVTVAFTAVSSGGQVVLAVNADPSTCPDVDRLMAALTEQLGTLDGQA